MRRSGGRVHESSNYVEEHTVAAGDIGGIAEESIYRHRMLKIC